MIPIEAIAAVAFVGVPWAVGIYFLVVDPIRWRWHNRKRAKGVEIPLGRERL